MRLRPLFAPLVLVAALPACGPDASALRDAEERAALQRHVEAARAETDQAAKAAQAARDEVRRLRDDVTSLATRVSELEARPVAAGTAAPAPADPAAAKPAAPDRKAALAELRALQEKVFAGTATDEEQQRFWELARTAAVVDELMKSFEAKVAADPANLDARMQLAQAYIAKLMSIPQGPEQGLWSNKAVQQWSAVLEKDPDHWDARFSLAFNWSMWPDFLNKTPDAIREFEKVRDVQERQAPQTKFAQTYLQLSRLYQKQGKAEKAQETLRAGLARFPDDAELRKALGALEE